MGGWRKRAERVEKLSLHSLRALSKSLVQRVLVDVVDGGPRRVVEVRRGRIWGHQRCCGGEQLWEQRTQRRRELRRTRERVHPGPH
jgi:hypothetical protein